jgi:hypothetical protein
VNDEFQSILKGARIGRNFHCAPRGGTVNMKMLVSKGDTRLQIKAAPELRMKPGRPIPYSTNIL